MEIWTRSRPRAQVDISRYVDEHYLDANGELSLKPVQKDMQEYIESSRDTSLQAILDKLSNFSENSYINPSDDYVADVVCNRDALDLMLEADSVLDNIRAEYNLAGKSRKQVVDFIRGKAFATFEEWQIENKNKTENNNKTNATNSNDNANGITEE